MHDPVLEREHAEARLLAAVGGGAVAIADGRAAVRRRTAGSWLWRIAGAPVEAQRARDLVSGTIRTLLHGRAYAEVLGENLGQPDCDLPV